MITIDLTLKDTLYTPGSLLTAYIRFSGKMTTLLLPLSLIGYKIQRRDLFRERKGHKEDGKVQSWQFLFRHFKMMTLLNYW